MELTDFQMRDLDELGRGLGRWMRTERWSQASAFTPSPEYWESLLFADVPLQRALRLRTGRCVGVVQLVSVNIEDGFGHLEILLNPDHFRDAEVLIARFVDRCFADFPLRKLLIYAALDEITLPHPVDVCAEHAGELRAHRRRTRDEYVAVTLLEVWFEEWAVNSAASTPADQLGNGTGQQVGQLDA